MAVTGSGESRLPLAFIWFTVWEGAYGCTCATGGPACGTQFSAQWWRVAGSQSGLVAGTPGCWATWLAFCYLLTLWGMSVPRRYGWISFWHYHIYPWHYFSKAIIKEVSTSSIIENVLHISMTILDSRVQVHYSILKPQAANLEHHLLWRCALRLGLPIHINQTVLEVRVLLLPP